MLQSAEMDVRIGACPDSPCDLARLADEIIVPDASANRRFGINPLVTGAQGIPLYASQPLRSQ